MSLHKLLDDLLVRHQEEIGREEMQMDMAFEDPFHSEELMEAVRMRRWRASIRRSEEVRKLQKLIDEESNNA